MSRQYWELFISVGRCEVRKAVENGLHGRQHNNTRTVSNRSHYKQVHTAATARQVQSHRPRCRNPSRTDRAGPCACRELIGHHGSRMRLSVQVRCSMNRLSLLTCIAVLLLAACSPAPRPVTVQDANLAAVIREQLGLPATAELTDQQLAGLQELEANQQGIADLTGLEHAYNLQELKLASNDITDLNPLSNLVELRVLHLYGNKVSELSALSGLDNLVELQLNANRIESLSPLKRLTNLQILSVAGNRIISLAPLKDLQQLAALDAGANLVTDVKPLAQLSSLDRLYIDLNLLTDISPLLENDNLRGGTMLSVRNNCLDVTAGSDTSMVLERLMETMLEVRFEPQRECR